VLEREDRLLARVACEAGSATGATTPPAAVVPVIETVLAAAVPVVVIVWLAASLLEVNVRKPVELIVAARPMKIEGTKIAPLSIPFLPTSS